MSYPPHHKEVVNLLLRQEWYLQRLYANLSRDLASVLRKYKVKGKKNMWYGNAEVKKEINALMKRYERIYFSHISEQIKKGWELSNKHNDTFVNNYTKGIKVPKKEKQKYYQRNNKALNAFVNRSQNGYKLSDRVWNLTNQTQEQIDHFIKAGLTDGRSASKLSQDVRQFLKEPDKRFRRIRDKETGKLKLSKPAKNYHPGQGVYRSSYKNALRLARNEINIAYRTSDFERRKQLPFVLGVNVKLSPAHPQYDICDELQGEYPKNFKFTGWHPNCLCYTTSKLMDKKDFVKYLKGEKQPTGHTKRIPKRAEKFIKDNSEKIKNYKGKPYFIADNFKATKDGFELKKEISQVGSKKDIINTKNPNVSIHKNAQRQDLRRNYQVANICAKYTGYRFFIREHKEIKHLSNPEYLINEQYLADRKSIESNNGIITQIDFSKKQMMNKKTNPEQLPYYIVFDLDKIENISWKKITHNISKKITKKRGKNIKGLFFQLKNKAIIITKEEILKRNYKKLDFLK